MSNIDIDLNKAESLISAYNSTGSYLNTVNDHLSTITGELNTFGIIYFDSIKSYINNINTSIINCSRLTSNYMDELNSICNREFDENKDYRTGTTTDFNISSISKDKSKEDSVLISGIGLASIAAVLGGIGAIATSYSALNLSDKDDDKTLSNAMDEKNPNYKGVPISGEVGNFIGGVIGGASGMSTSELLTGTYPDKLAAGTRAFDGMMNLFNEAGNLSTDELTFALSGEPYIFKIIPADVKLNTIIEISKLVNDYKSIDGVIANVENIILKYNRIGDAYNALRNVFDGGLQLLIGLSDSNCNIGGITISREAKDYIINYLERTTNIKFSMLISGAYNNQLMAALNSLIDTLEIYKKLGSLTKEELEKYLVGIMNGKYPVRCGITCFNVKALKSYLLLICQNNYLRFDDLLANKTMLISSIKEFTSFQKEIDALYTIDENSIQGAINTLFTTGSLNVNGIMISANSRAIIQYMLDAYAQYRDIPFEELLFNNEFAYIVRNNVNELYKYMIYLSVVLTTSIDKAHLRFTNMFQGKRMGLLGFTNDDMGLIKKKIESYSIGTNLDIKTFLTTGAGINTIPEILRDDDNYIKLRIIFDDATPITFNNILYNLIKSWDDDFNYRMVNVINYVNRKRLIKIVETAREDTKNSLALANIDNLINELNILLNSPEEEILSTLNKISRGEPNPVEGRPFGYSLSYLLRLFLYGLSAHFKTSCRDILIEPNYRLFIFMLIRQAPKYLYYIEYDNMLDPECLYQFFNKLYSGYYPELIGINKEKLDNVERIFIGMANSKNLTIKDLLSNSIYAEEIANVMKRDSQSLFMNLYSNKNSIEIQNVVYNMIINSKSR